jgi:hypothetical protein
VEVPELFEVGSVTRLVQIENDHLRSAKGLSLGSTRRSAASDYSLSLRCVARVTYPPTWTSPGPSQQAL